MRISDEEKQAVRKDMLTDLGLLSADEEDILDEAANPKPVAYYRGIINVKQHKIEWLENELELARKRIRKLELQNGRPFAEDE